MLTVTRMKNLEAYKKKMFSKTLEKNIIEFLTILNIIIKVIIFITVGIIF